MKPAAAYVIITELWSDGMNRTRPGEGKFTGYRTMVYTPKAVGHTTRLGKIISRSYGRWGATVSAADAVAVAIRLILLMLRWRVRLPGMRWGATPSALSD